MSFTGRPKIIHSGTRANLPQLSGISPARGLNMRGSPPTSHERRQARQAGGGSFSRSSPDLNSRPRSLTLLITLASQIIAVYEDSNTPGNLPGERAMKMRIAAVAATLLVASLAANGRCGLRHRRVPSGWLMLSLLGAVRST